MPPCDGRGQHPKDRREAPLNGKYARYEFERRFLLAAVPRDVRMGEGWHVTDLYICGTRLRLRCMRPLAGGQPVYKLGQKQVPAPPDYSRVELTNIYLSPQEYDVFAVLDGWRLEKRRHRLKLGDATYAIDVFEDELSGLVLAEVSFGDVGTMRSHDPPSWAVTEVSTDVRFTGGELARTSRADLQQMLREMRP